MSKYAGPQEPFGYLLLLFSISNISEMLNKWNLIPVFWVAFYLLTADNATAQASQTDIPWHLTEHGGRVAALGQSTAALDNHPYLNPNPAIPVENGHIYFSSPVFSTTVVSGNPAVFSGNHIDASLYSPYMAIGWDRISVSAAVRHTNHSDLKNRMLRTNISYRLSDFYLGVGLAYNRYTPGFEDLKDPLENILVSMGMFYRPPDISTDRFMITPEIGLALTDISNTFETIRSTTFEFPPNYREEPSGFEVITEKSPPGQLRLGLGVVLTTQRQWMEQPVFSVGLYTGHSKYLSGFEGVSGEPAHGNPVSGLNMITSTWSTTTLPAGGRWPEVGIREQISHSFGMELRFVEGLIGRFGFLQGADWWVNPRVSYGLGLDLYYLTLSYTRVTEEISEITYGDFNRGDKWSDSSFLLQVRIPIHGAPNYTNMNYFLDGMSSFWDRLTE